MNQEWARSGFRRCILRLVVQEVDNTKFGATNQRRKPRKFIESNFDIVIQFFQNTILVSTISDIVI
jgi:hypothetical protein